MAPTESTILTNFLLPPSPLPTILSLQKFTSLFPKAQRSNPQVKYLYRELQHLRALDIDEVKQNIVREVKVGEKQRREVIRARRRADKVEVEGFDEREIEMEAQVRYQVSYWVQGSSRGLDVRAFDDRIRQAATHIVQYLARDGTSLRRHRRRD